MASVNRALFEVLSRRVLALQARVLRDAFFSGDGAVCVAVLPRALVTELGATEDDTGGLSGFLRNIEGVEVAALAKETEAGDFKISMRSNERVDVSALCASLGGGGHIRAAGCRLPGPAEAVRSALIDLLCRAADASAPDQIR